MSLRACQLCLELSGVPLLRDLDVTLEPGKVQVVLGPNGAGKTSLLRVLSGELPASAGDVTLNDREIGQWGGVQRARTLAVLPQGSLLNFPFTVDEVVLLGRTPHDTGVVRDKDIAEAALRAVDADYLAGRLYTRLSGGEKQRVHLARVLAQIWEPSEFGDRYLILDEPTASFDLAHQQLTLAVVRNFAAQGVGVLMVLHDLNLAAACADHILLMRCGEVVATGSPAMVLTPDNIGRVFDVSAHIGSHPETGKPLVIV